MAVPIEDRIVVSNELPTTLLSTWLHQKNLSMLQQLYSDGTAAYCGLLKRLISVYTRAFSIKMRDTGILDQLSHGVSRLSDLPPLSDPDLVTVATKIPEAIICLIPALTYHELTTQIPAEVSIALKANSRVPKFSYPPIKTYWYSKSTYSAGFEKHKIDNVDVRIYSPERNDCGLLQVQKPNRYGHCANGALTLSRTKKAKAQDPNAIRADLSGGENNASIP